jgi:pimeloyl-ACP methyl ester carboxylesterase
MINGWNRALRFGKGWKLGASGLQESEVEIPTPLGPVPATYILPQGAAPPLPGWVTLHGITRPGRKHPTLIRFVRALANSGAAVLVPEILPWRELELAPLEASQILKASILELAGRRETDPHRLGAMGFSFGSPVVLMAGADPELIPHLKVVTGFGGYADMERTTRFLFRGTHDWEGDHYDMEPDPYGRWVVAGNFLSRVPGYEASGDVARALIRLAAEAGDTKVPSWEFHFESRQAQLEADIDPGRWQLFRDLALAHGVRTPEGLARELAPALAKAALATSPLLDPPRHMKDVRVPVRLIHGRGDRLIPFTETLRLAESFHEETPKRVYLTGLFSHSQRDEGNALFGEIGEMSRFLHMMSDILGLL